MKHLLISASLGATLALVATTPAHAQVSPFMGDLNSDLTVDDEELNQWENNPNYELWVFVIEPLVGLIPDGMFPRPECNSTGVQWSSARVVAVGETRCDGISFTLDLSGSEYPDVRVNWVGCPTYCDIEVGHNKPVPQQGMHAAQVFEFPWQRQEYEASCTTPSCRPLGLPRPLAVVVPHWAAVPCGDGGSGGGDGQPGGGAAGSGGNGDQ